jgi:hypothetical protein
MICIGSDEIVGLIFVDMLSMTNIPVLRKQSFKETKDLAQVLTART